MESLADGIASVALDAAVPTIEQDEVQPDATGSSEPTVSAEGSSLGDGQGADDASPASASPEDDEGAAARAVVPPPVPATPVVSWASKATCCTYSAASTLKTSGACQSIGAGSSKLAGSASGNASKRPAGKQPVRGLKNLAIRASEQCRQNLLGTEQLPLCTHTRRRGHNDHGRSEGLAGDERNRCGCPVTVLKAVSARHREFAGGGSRMLKRFCVTFSRDSGQRVSHQRVHQG